MQRFEFEFLTMIFLIGMSENDGFWRKPYALQPGLKAFRSVQYLASAGCQASIKMLVEMDLPITKAYMLKQDGKLFHWVY